jgi:arylsulfatase A-like enzyme
MMRVQSQLLSSDGASFLRPACFGRNVLSVTAYLPFFLLWIPVGAAEPVLQSTDQNSAAQGNRPNILFIVADDLGWSDVGWHQGFARTPRMDQLVQEGVELDQHYVQPVCTPTRTALMSGRYPGRFGPHALAPSNLRAMPIGTTTLASALKSLGYFTCQSGKWHLGSRREWGPIHFGFDHGYGTMTGAADPWTHKYRRGEYEDTWHRDGVPLHEDGNATDLIAAEAIRRIEEKREPWFIYVPFHAVHTPVDAPKEFLDLYRDVRFDADAERHDSRLRLAAMISQLDARIGDLVDALDRTGQRSETLIVFTSDNGGIESLKNAYVGDVGDSPLNSENDPLRGQKATLYEGGIRVCAFANWPGQLKPHRFSSPMHIVDWLPTIAEITGYSPSESLNWDGISQWSALNGTASADANREIYIASKQGACLRKSGWKLIQPHQGSAQLFHIETDPFEKNDCAMSHPQMLEQMTESLRAQESRDLREIPSDLREYHR